MIREFEVLVLMPNFVALRTVDLKLCPNPKCEKCGRSLKIGEKIISRKARKLLKNSRRGEGRRFMCRECYENSFYDCEDLTEQELVDWGMTSG